MDLQDHQDAITADLRRHYGISLTQAVTELPMLELVSLLDRLPRRDSELARDVLGPLADWSPADENLAMLVDAQRNWLQFMWSQWNATEADRRRARHGRGPKTPPLAPYAARPPEVAQALTAAGRIDQPPTAGPGAGAADGPAVTAARPHDRSGMRSMSIEELARLV